MLLQQQLTLELGLVALGAVTGWSAVVGRGRVPAWVRELWEDRIADDSAPDNLPVRIWLPVLIVAILVAGLLFFYVIRF